jgi:hypothetical protein
MPLLTSNMERTTTTTTQPTLFSSPTDGEIKVLSKNGPYNKWFDSKASQILQALYAVHFGQPMVTKAAIGALRSSTFSMCCGSRIRGHAHHCYHALCEPPLASELVLSDGG